MLTGDSSMPEYNGLDTGSSMHRNSDHSTLGTWHRPVVVPPSCLDSEKGQVVYHRARGALHPHISEKYLME